MNRDAQVDFDALHAAIENEIKAAFPTLQTVEFYRMDRGAVTTPAVLMEMTELEAAPSDPGTEQLAMVAHFEANIILGFNTPAVKIEIRKLAASLANFLRLRRWAGVKTGPAEVVGCYRDDFHPELDQYEVWRVDWTHIVHIGPTTWTNEGIQPTQVFLGVSPDIGPGHVGDYTDVTA